MTENLPIVTVIIPARPEQAEIRAVTGARQLEYPKDKLEIIIVTGKQPSAQRNLALKEARGEIIYFLDDDSVPFAGNLRRAVFHFSSPEVEMVGGPNICPPDAPMIQQIFWLTMASRIAFSSSCARYRSVGKLRESSEKELILCNLLARRDTVIELGGFNELLYPNEENALMDEIQQHRGKLVYDPELIVFRHPRPTLRAFVEMLMAYGRGRAEQVRLYPTIGSLQNLVPAMFLLYLLLAPFLPRLLLLPIPFYLVAMFAQAIVSLRPSQWLWVPHLMGCIFMSHVFYGFGFWRGMFTKPKLPSEKISTEVRLKRISFYLDDEDDRK